MKRLTDESQVHAMPESTYKQAMTERIAFTHSSFEAMDFDIMADCGGDFYLLEEGDDPKGIILYEGGDQIDLTDFDKMCFEYIELSEDGRVFELYWPTNDAGGPSFFIPNEPWIGDGFMRALSEAIVPAS